VTRRATRAPGNSIFFSVKRIEDPIGLLPAKLILGINKARPARPGPAGLFSLPSSWRPACSMPGTLAGL